MTTPAPPTGDGDVGPLRLVHASPEAPLAQLVAPD